MPNGTMNNGKIMYISTHLSQWQRHMSQQHTTSSVLAQNNLQSSVCFLQVLQCYAQVVSIPRRPWSRNWRIMPYPKMPPITSQTAGNALCVHQSSQSLYVAINTSVDQQRALWKKTPAMMIGRKPNTTSGFRH